jgi:hypothetical protein
VVETGHGTTEHELEKHFHDFKSFYSQYDVRRKKDFKKTFPELSEWYDSIIIDDSINDIPINDGSIIHFETGDYDEE